MSPIPVVVQEILNEFKIPVLPTTAHELYQSVGEYTLPPYSSKLAHCVLVKDYLGPVQVFIPGDRMLDLTQLSQVFGRQFSTLTIAEVNKLKIRYGLNEFPAIPQITDLETMIDQALLREEELYVYSGNIEKNQLKIPMSAFRALTAHAHVGNYTAPLRADSLKQDSIQDLNDIHTAICRFTPLRIKQRLEQTLDLPPLPSVAHKIIELRVDPEADIKTLAATIAIDPSMSAQVLSWARSPYYGAPGKVQSIEDAVIRVLGFDLVINLALGLALGRSISVPKDGPHGYASFWKQAVLTATLCGDLVKKIPVAMRPPQGMAYLSGLLHNFGFLILAHVFPPQFSLVNRHIEVNSHINRTYIENHLLGISREQCAATLMSEWQMPEELITALRQMHNPNYEEDHSDYANLLYVAVRLLRERGVGDGPTETIPEAVFDRLGLTQENAAEVADNLVDNQDSFADLIGILNR